jgi:hypothetical protein
MSRVAPMSRFEFPLKGEVTCGLILVPSPQKYQSRTAGVVPTFKGWLHDIIFNRFKNSFIPEPRRAFRVHNWASTARSYMFLQRKPCSGYTYSLTFTHSVEVSSQKVKLLLCLISLSLYH